VLKEEKLMKLMKESYSFNSEIFNKIKIKYDKRLGTKLEYEKIRTKISESNLNISIQQSNVEESKINLRNYLQIDINSNEIQSPEFKYNLPMNLTSALSNAYTTHPSLKVSELNKKVALNEYKRDNNIFLPKVNLVGKYSKNDLDEEVNQYSIGVELKYNIYNGGKDTALSNKLLKYINEKMIYTEKTKQEIENKMRFSWNAYFLNQSKLENLKEYVYYKKNVLDTSFKEYELGMIDISDLLTIHEEYISAKKSLILIENDFLFSKFRILDATGNIVEKLIDIQEYSANRFNSEEN
jgi:adhesin transport system outer membrane protein